MELSALTISEAAEGLKAKKFSSTELTKAVLPWLITMLIFLVIVTYWPWLTLVLPRAMGMMS